MKKIMILFLCSSLLLQLQAQQNVGIGTNTPHASALLHLNSTTKGLLIPRMATADRLLITSPADGLMVYDTDIKNFWYYDGVAATWKELNGINGSLPAGAAGNTLRHDGTSWIADTYLSNDGSRIGIGISSPSEGLHSDSSVKIGNSVWSSSANSRFLKFGDGNFITMGEDSLDDRLHFKARDYVFGKSSPGYSGNVGIGVIGTPSAKLHVNGTVRITDGNQAAGRVLTSDAAGNASWQAPPCMQNRVVYKTSGVNNFTVPVGITKLFVEVWSAGGNGSAYNANPLAQLAGGGGGSGAYANFFITVTPSTTVTVTVGSTGVSNSAVTYGANSMILSNGLNADNFIGPGGGGTLITDNFPDIFFIKGSNGVINFNTVYNIGGSWTEYRGGKGGDAPLGGTGGNGEVFRTGPATFNSGTIYSNGNFPGGGGGAGTAIGTGFGSGMNGSVIIHY